MKRLVTGFFQPNARVINQGGGSGKIVKYFILALGILLLPFSGAAAEKSIKPTSMVRGYVPVQLESFSVPTIIGNNLPGRGPITLFLVVRGQWNVTRLCRYLPRVHEAITLTVDQNPVPVVGETYQLDDIGQRLHRAINNALPAPLVIRLHLFPVAREVGHKAVYLELPGTNENCMSLREMPADTMIMLKGENPIAKTFRIPDPKGPPQPAEGPSTASAKPVGRAVAEPPIIVQRATPQPAPEPRSEPNGCVKLGDVWKDSFHKVSGAKYWLDRAFSLDENKDGAIDNVVLILKADNRKDISVYYFPTKGRQTVKTVPTLRLEDDRVVLRTCFGQAHFKKPVIKIKEPPSGFKVDLAKEVADKAAEEAKPTLPTPVVRKKFLEGAGMVFAIVMGAGVLLVLGGGAGFAIARRRKDRLRKERRGGEERRVGERRQRESSFEGPDKRKDKDRRADADRREEQDRRQDEDRRT